MVQDAWNKSPDTDTNNWPNKHRLHFSSCRNETKPSRHSATSVTTPMEAGERQPRPAADTSLRRSDTPTGSLLRDRLLLRLLACFLKLAETGDSAGSATTVMVSLGPKAVLLTAVSASLALGLRAEAEEAMWAVGCGGGALRRPGEVWCVRRPSAIARRGGSGGGRRAGEVLATAAGRSAL